MASFTVTGLTDVVNQLLPEPHAGLLVGLLFGTKASLSREFYQALITTGTLHIIALSGMNITIIMGMIASSLQWWLGKRRAGFVSLLGIVWFVWFVGPSPTIVRAAIMGSISLFSVVFGRQYWALLSWALALGTMLLVHIEWISDISFQLSALATLGIILFGKKTHKNVLIENLHLTLAAQIFTIPLILFHFHRISFIAPLANVAIGWVVAPLTMLGWVTAVAGWVLLPVGAVFAWVAWVLLEYMIRVIYLVSTIPMASLGW